jgi:hypothetical protein
MNKITIITLTMILISCDSKANKKKEGTPLSQKEQVKTMEENEEFKQLNSDDLNQLLTEKERNLSAKEVMRLFYPHKVETSEGNEKIELTEKVSNNGKIVVTLIHDNLLDDSVRGEKYVMELRKSNNRWAVISIKKNWKCWDGRGHTDWGIKLCN